MKYVNIAVLFLALLIQAGCSKPVTKCVDVKIEGDGDFPKFLVGRWKADKRDWEMVFEPDGTISEAVYTIGKTLVRSKHTSTVDSEEAKSIFQSGCWSVNFSPELNELGVEIVIDYVYLEMGPVVLEGTIKDVFSGKVSEEQMTWTAEWYSFPQYHTPDNKDLIIGPSGEEVFVDVLTFTKVEE